MRTEGLVGVADLGRTGLQRLHRQAEELELALGELGSYIGAGTGGLGCVGHGCGVVGASGDVVCSVMGH